MVNGGISLSTSPPTPQGPGGWTPGTYPENLDEVKARYCEPGADGTEPQADAGMFKRLLSKIECEVVRKMILDGKRVHLAHLGSNVTGDPPRIVPPDPVDTEVNGDE